MHAENIRIAMKKRVTQQEALRQLAAMCATAEHCRHDMLQKMQAWGLSEEAQEHIIHQLVEGRYVDDERYCRAFVADKMKYNKWGRRKIDMALCQKRIEADIRHRVLGAVEPDEFIAILRPLIDSKRKSIKADNPRERNAKLMRFALQRGFTIDEINECISGEDY